MTLSSDYILIQRGDTTYKAKLEALSSVIVLRDMKEDFNKFLDDLSTSFTDLTTSFDIVFYTSNEMKSNFTSKESLSTLNEDGTFVLNEDAANTAKTLVEETKLYKAGDDSCWYEKTLGKCVKSLTEAFNSSKGMMTQGKKIDGSRIGEYHDIDVDGALKKWGGDY